jgi:hypothetical protein
MSENRLKGQSELISKVIIEVPIEIYFIYSLYWYFYYYYIMKNIINPSGVAFLFLLASMFYGCKKSPDTIPQLIPGYDEKEAGVIMTLAAISYIAENQQPEVIKDSITVLLEDPALATRGQWKLVWGPGISGIKDNLVYIAVDSTSSPISYAVAIRGTNSHSIDDIVQDFQAAQVPFKYGSIGDSVARGSMRGLDSLLNTHDPVTGENIEDFLRSLPMEGKKKMFITGHSQGGALAPLMTYWFIKNAGLMDRFTIETYAFAGPSVGNESFKINFFNSLPETGLFHMVSNPLDIVPYFWAKSDSIIIKNIPTDVPLFYEGLIEAANIYLQDHHIHYVQLADQIYLGSFTPVDTLGNIHPSEAIKWYDYWAMKEHTHNSYLELLKVNPIPD